MSNTENSAIKFIITLGKTASVLSNRLDRGLGGLGFTEFLILYYLNQAEEQKMSRVDLAAKVGLTASGITRLLLPMEKVHVVKSGPQEQDARVRSVTITSAGKQKLEEAVERVEIFATDIIAKDKLNKLDEISDLLLEIAGRALVV
ncbi:MAG TPA: MarR family transcriptional regulator [Candidatus Magasanikbacteria bacterium]|nr:MarR family transcriptional regulator [Candidatus Magasanikbacteria bacterium]